MSKEKQIKEKHELSESIYMSGHGLDWQDSDDIAEQLYHEGYRKQSEGEWVYVHTYMRGRCSVCNHQMQYDNQPFCSNCGAKMKGV